MNHNSATYIAYKEMHMDILYKSDNFFAAAAFR